MYRHHYFEERLNIVSRLLSGEPLATLCRELKMDKKMVRLWYLRYIKYGEDGLRCLRFTRNSHYTADEKLAIVKEFLEKGVTLQELCLRYDLSRSAISTWCRLHRQGLSLENRKRRPRAPMARPKKKEEQTELERLQAENLRLRAENALLKKVKALVEEQEARARLNGQKPSRN